MPTATIEPTQEQTVGPEHYHFAHKYHFMTEAEQAVFRILDEAFGHDYYIFAQVYLPTIVYVQEHIHSRILGAIHRINKYSVDFVLCDRNSMQPLLAIELDDWSHQLLRRRLRDQFVELILRDAQLKLLRISNYQEMGPDEIIRQVTAKLER